MLWNKKCGYQLGPRSLLWGRWSPGLSKSLSIVRGIISVKGSFSRLWLRGLKFPDWSSVLSRSPALPFFSWDCSLKVSIQNTWIPIVYMVTEESICFSLLQTACIERQTLIGYVLGKTRPLFHWRNSVEMGWVLLPVVGKVGFNTCGGSVLLGDAEHFLLFLKHS